MLIPYRVDVPFNHRPVMNWLLAACVIAAFILQLYINVSGDDEAINKYVLDGWNITGLFGHMWLHGDVLHLLGNLLFLWLFGNAVCSKVGNLMYLPIYIGLGLIAAASHLLLVDGRAVGASGAINGIVGMYLVLFPENAMDCFFLLFFKPIYFSISGFWMILLWFVFDISGAIRGNGNVAYFAHIGGFLGGFALASLSLKYKWIVMESDEKSIYDILLRKSRESNIPKEEAAFWKEEFKKSEIKKTQAFTTATIPQKPVIDTLRFNCSCGQKIKVPGIYAGKRGRCPKCKAMVNIPNC